MAGEWPESGGAGGEEQTELPLEEVASRLGIPASTLYKRIRAGTLPARQEPGGRRRWMVSVDQLPAAAQRVVGHPPERDSTGVIIELLRQVDATSAALRDAEGRAVRLETENAALRARVRDLQHVLRSLGAAMSDSIRALTMPDSLND